MVVDWMVESRSRDRKLVTPFENIFSAALSNFHHYFRTNGGHPVKSVWSKTGEVRRARFSSP